MHTVARDYVEHLKRKPVHVRRQIAIISAAAVTAVVAVGYLVALASSGALALSDSPSPELNVAKEQAGSNISGLAGAAAAFKNLGKEGELNVVDAGSSSTLEQSDTGSATVIPF